MIKSFRFSSLAWLAAPLCALAFLFGLNAVRIQHIQEVSSLGGWGEKPPGAVATATSSSSELAAGNGLIIPEHLNESYHWLAQTQRMFKRGEWRIRHIDYENAPFGRTVYSTSPYRWWLGSIAWVDHIFSGGSPIQSVERAALVADPLLHGLLLLGTTIFVAWRFGVLPAALMSIGLAAIFPFAADFLPGAPDDRGMAQIFALWSVLLLLAGVSGRTKPGEFERSTRRWFFCAGVTGGLGLWLSVSVQVPVLAGVVVGAFLSEWIARDLRNDGSKTAQALPWREWALGGALVSLTAYLIEFAPAYLGHGQLTVIHPVYGLAWLGAGEGLAQVAGWIQGGKVDRRFRSIARIALAVVAIAAVPFAIWKAHGRGFLIPDTASLRLTKLPEGAIAESLGAWISRDGITGSVLATLLPLLFIAPAVWLLLRRPIDRGSRTALALALGPVLIAASFACMQLVRWNDAGGLLLVLLVAATVALRAVTNSSIVRLSWAGLVVLLLSPGILQLLPRAKASLRNGLTQTEVLGLIERDLAGWIALRANPGGVVVLAPPNETTALCYYGAMRGIGTLSLENKEGVAAAIRILSAPSLQEAKELIDRRTITHIVILSWDTSFDNFARVGTGKIEGTFRHELRFSTLPLWLRPLAYPIPTITGFEGQSATIYEVVEEQNEATALVRIAAYFVEMGEMEQAMAAAQGLRRFPADLGAWIARAEVELAVGDEAGIARSLKVLQGRLAAKIAPALSWEQRVRLAIVLAKTKEEKLSREQVSVCLSSADESKLRALSPGSVYRLLVLSRAFGLTLDPRLREIALDLVPSEQRDRIK